MPLTDTKIKNAKATDKQYNSFKSAAMEWYRRLLPSRTDGHSRTILSRLERDVLPWIGQQPIKESSHSDVLRVLRRVEARGAIDTSHRIKTMCGQIFRYAVATGQADRDPTADLKGALIPVQPKHMADIVDPSHSLNGQNAGFNDLTPALFVF